MRKPVLLVLQLMLLGTLVLPSWTPARADTMTCSPIPVTIEIKPKDNPNSATINLGAQGLIPVAVLSDSTFDATHFSPEMAHLSDASMSMTMPCTGAEAVRWSRQDVNKDGKLDLVFFFKVQDMNLTPSSTAASLMAHGAYNGTTLHIMGTEPVVLVP